MTLRVFNYAANAWKTVTGIKVRVGGTWKDMTGVKTYQGGAWKDAYPDAAPAPPPPPPGPPPPPPPPPPPSLTVSADPTSVSGTIRSNSDTGPVTTVFSTLTASGGTAPYDYSWELSSWDSFDVPIINDPDAQTTSFTLNSVDYLYGHNTATIIGRVQDSLGTVAQCEVAAVFHSLPAPGG